MASGKICNEMDAGMLSGALVERERELSLLARLAAEAASGEGRLALVVGEAGIGKTAVLAASRASARDVGLCCLGARASELEEAFAFGVVRQLLDPVLMERVGAEREELFSGAASLARPVFSAGTPLEAAQADLDFGILHGLYWLVAALAREQALCLAIDDIHWADAPSLRFVQFLVRRIEGLPVLVLAAARSGEPSPSAGLVGELFDEPLTVTVTPAPLSRGGVAEVVGVGVDDGDAAPLVEALRRASGGNPLYLHTLLADLSASGPLDADGLEGRGSESIARLVGRRLAALAPDAAAIAQAMAVLGDGTEMRHVMALAGVTQPARAGAAVRALQGAAIFEGGDRLAFTHPVVRASLYERLREPERAERHADAARILAAGGALRDEIAAQLQRTRPGAVPEAFDTLRAAAADALARGAPEVGAGLLERALAEDIDGATRVDILLALGDADMRAGRPSALVHLQSALREARDPERRTSAALGVARLLYRAGRAGDGIELLDQIARALGDGAPSHVAQLEEEIVSLADLDLAARPHARGHIERCLAARSSDAAAGPLLCAHLAIDAVMRGDDARRTASLARRALADPLLGDQAQAGSSLFFILAYALAVADCHDEAEWALTSALEAARARGAAITFAQAAAIRGFVRVHRGDLIGGEADVRACLDAAALNHWPPLAQIAITVLITLLVDRGELDQIAQAAAACGIDLDTIEPTTQGVVLLAARGQVRLAAGDPAGAVADLLEAGRHLTQWGMSNPAPYMWRSHAALGLRLLGELDRARALADEELALSRRWGGARAVGVALRAAGLLADGDRQFELLGESVATLRGSGATLELARALADQGAALRRANRRADAREPLREGVQLARECGAQVLVNRAHTELWATGARPRTPLRTGVDALTPSERRVADLAISGRSNPEIAQSLFITTKTVESHLSRAYRKLDIASRDELAGALAPAPH